MATKFPWRPIETVVRDERVLLAIQGKRGAVWTGKIGARVDIAALRLMSPHLTATHWAPCPEPPARKRVRR